MLVFASSALLFSACATQSTVPVGQDSWRAQGKFSFHSDETRQSGNFDWRQSGESYRVRLFGPLGFGTVQIEGDDQQVIIRSSKEERFSQDPDNLIYQMTGMHLPLTDIPDWLQGKPSTYHQEHAQIDANGNLAQTFVHGWQINYDNYSDENLPGRIEATMNSTALTLVVLDWGS